MSRHAARRKITGHALRLQLEATGTREAVRGLVEVFADVRGIGPSSTVPLVLSPDSSEELLVTLLEDVLYLLDAEDVVPVDVAIAAADDGGVAVEFFVVASDAVRQQGAIPKAIARHGLQLRPSAGHWRCRVTVDV